MRLSRQLIDQGDEFKQAPNIESARRDTDRVIGRWRCSVSPLLWYGKAATLAAAQPKRVDASDPPFLDDEEALAFQWMKRMTDLGPAQSRAEQMCS